ncbi:MAG: AAA family ATPase, partial [Clostridia bacterium]|nr:AAA family ATPase [Clostridia bacterium]
MAVYPVQHTILLPDTTLYLPTERFRALMERFPRLDEKMTLILMRDGEDYEHLTEDSFYPIGLTGTVCEVSRDGWFAVRTSARVHLDEIAVTPPAHIEVYTSRLSDTDDQDPRLEAQKVQELRQQLDDFIRQARWGTMTDEMKEHMKTLRDIAVALSPYMAAPTSERYALLEEDSTRRRCEMIEKMVLETLESARLSQEGSQQQTEEYQKNVRESAIRKQMDYLQKELDEMHPENVSDIRRLEIRIEESGMNETARREADKLIRRLKQEGQGSAETGMLYNYLDFLTSLSWKKEEVREIDLKHAEEILEEDHFGLNKVKNRILQQIAVMNLKHRQSGSILLFVGAPGTGKTSIGQSIARALGREYVRVSLGGVRDEADIRGHRRTYIGSMPGRIMDAIQKSGVSNPVMVLDEVDKLSQSYNGDPASALLEVLDPEQNSTFTDHYMNVPYDLSDVFFICTANTVDTIPEPLLNRMEVIQFQGYTPMEKKEIARKHLLPKAMDAVGLSGDHLQVTDAAIEQVIASYTREGGVRGLKKRM